MLIREHLYSYNFIFHILSLLLFFSLFQSSSVYKLLAQQATLGPVPILCQDRLSDPIHLPSVSHKECALVAKY